MVQKHSKKTLIEEALEESRKKRLSISSRLPLVKGIQDDALRYRFLRTTRALTRLLDHSPIREGFGFIYGGIGPRLFILLNGIKETDTFIDNVKDYLRITSLWGLFPVEVLSSSDSHIEVKYSQCPLGIQHESKLCSAYMALEPRLSKENIFRTRISVLECIPDGQGQCRILFERK